MDIAREEHGDVTVVALGGDFDFHDVAQATDAIGSYLEGGVHRLVFDLKGLGFISSGGIGFLIQTVKRLRALGGDAVLAAPPANFGWVIETLGIDRVFRIFADAAEAVAHFRATPAGPRKPPS
jgi:anti-sigma B factor antagonist